MQAKLEVKNESELNDFMTSNVATTNHNNTNITDKICRRWIYKKAKALKVRKPPSPNQQQLIAGLNSSTEQKRDEDIRESPVQQNKESKKVATSTIMDFNWPKTTWRNAFLNAVMWLISSLAAGMHKYNLQIGKV